ncbi:MAG: hypothetical protein GQ569_15040 [Methylococcaceae bacterium]|nr:hypothetical protein [Methylococcaceae bacterium]
MKLDEQVYLLGIRHHGAGCASSLIKVLNELKPDLILLEGAAELQDSWSLVADPEMKPPIAQVIYDPAKPAQAVYYPWGEFSPEWQVMRYAATTETPLTMMDLPIAIDFALQAQETEALAAKMEAEAQNEEDEELDEVEENEDERDEPIFNESPFDCLAHAAGFDDGELWWEMTVEHQSSGLAMFAAIAEAMTASREFINKPLTQREALREAWMRKILRAARKTHQNIVVICGAWHIPALAAKIKIKDDNALLKGLKRKKTEVAWIPYLYSRFAYASGYGAGIQSPAWYEHLFKHHQRNSDNQTLVIEWQSKVAQLLRKQGFDCSSAQVIDAVMLAQNLATLRGFAIPSLAEMQDAAQSAMTEGNSQPLELIEQELIIGTRMGSLPENIPQLPLEQNLAAITKKLRLKRQPEHQYLSLDLRKDSGLARSVLFNRLNILNIAWATISHASTLGTFKEDWALSWQPEFALNLIDASRFGNTIEQAASRCMIGQIAELSTVASLAACLEEIRQADLNSIMPTAIKRLQTLAALSADLPDLMQALLSLVQELRYGSVRSNSGESLQALVDSMIIRICNGLANACLQLNEDAAYEMIEAIDKTHAAIAAINDEEPRNRWIEALNQVTEHGSCPPLLTGRCTRLLYDLGQRKIEDLHHAFALATSAANEVTDTAAWLEGLLYQGAILLLHDDAFFKQLDDWLQDLEEDDFMRILPLLRRVMTSFNQHELKQLGERVLQGATETQAEENKLIDADLAERALNSLLPLLGLS